LREVWADDCTADIGLMSSSGMLALKAFKAGQCKLFPMCSLREIQVTCCIADKGADKGPVRLAGAEVKLAGHSGSNAAVTFAIPQQARPREAKEPTTDEERASPPKRVRSSYFFVPSTTDASDATLQKKLLKVKTDGDTEFIIPYYTNMKALKPNDFMKAFTPNEEAKSILLDPHLYVVSKKRKAEA
jgi:hypothetical protein